MKASPLDVFWFQERLESLPQYRKHTLRVWLGSDDHGEGTPHRAPASSGSLELRNRGSSPKDWTHPDVIYEVVPKTPEPDDDDRGSLVTYLEKIDASAALPIDFILTCNASKALAKAARSLSIPLISLPASS